MTAWAINSAELDLQPLKISWNDIKLPKSLRAGQNVIFYRRRGGEILFASTTVIENVEVEVIGPSDVEAVVAMTFSEPVELKPARRLADFTYSLERVKRFDNPAKHFRPIVSLSNGDFHTIVQGHIFWARSAFGFFVNSIPPDRFLVFTQLVAQEAPDLLLETPDFSRLWRLLRDWIFDEYIVASLYATGIRELVNTVADNGTTIAFEELRLGQGDENLPKSASLLQLQANLAEFYNEVFGEGGTVAGLKDQQTFNPATLFDSIDQMIEANGQVEAQFQKIFSREQWPITQPIKL